MSYVNRIGCHVFLTAFPLWFGGLLDEMLSVSHNLCKKSGENHWPQTKLVALLGPISLYTVVDDDIRIIAVRTARHGVHIRCLNIQLGPKSLESTTRED